MQPNKIKNNLLYDHFFLTHTFDSSDLKKSAQNEIDWIIKKTKISFEARILGRGCRSNVSFQSSMLYVDKLIEPLNPDGSLFIYGGRD